MQRVSVVIFFVAIATSLMAASLDDRDISGLESFENDVNVFSHGDSQKQENNDHICGDFYSFICKKKKNKDLHQLKYKDHLDLLYLSEVHNALIDILNGEIEDEKDPIDIEKKLYQSCMNLGKDDKETDDIDNEIDDNNEKLLDDSYFTTETTFHDMLKHFDLEIKEDNWQKLDKKLALLGFKHSFFEINVVKDPETLNKNIIRLSPPSMTEWNFKKLTDVVSDIFTQQQLDAFDYCEAYYGSSDNSNDNDNRGQSDEDAAFWESVENKNDDSTNTDTENEIEPQYVTPLCEEMLQNQRSKLTEEIVKDLDLDAMSILNMVLKGIFDTVDTSNKDRKVQRLTIGEWNKMYKTSVKKNTAAINWYQVLKSYFKNLKIHVKNIEYILIENQPYFFKMADVFNSVTNEAIAHAIRSKFVAENLGYYNWSMVFKMNPVYKPSFCLEQNKFYGVSAEVLERLKLKMKPHDKKVESLLYGIVGALHSNISRAKVPEVKKTNLLSNLKHFTKDPFGAVGHFNVSEYYKDFEFTGVYLVDINSYNSMLRKQNLLKLRESSLSSPFSVLEKENPRNRYILHSALNAIIYKNKFVLNKDALYGTFGVKSASFLFSLLTENLNDLRDFRSSSSITPRVSYKPEQVACFIRENIVKYGYPVDYDIITEVFGIRFAYEAMLHHSKFESTEEFFTAYTEDHCRENDGKMINKVLSNVHEFSTALKCSKDEDTACKLQAFHYIK